MNRIIHGFGSMRPLKSRLIPLFRQFQHSCYGSAVRLLQQHWVTKKIFRITAAKHIHQQSSIGLDRAHLVTNFIHVRHKNYFGCFRIGLCAAQIQNQISRGVRVRLGPTLAIAF